MDFLALARELLVRAHPNLTEHVLNKLIRFREPLPLRRRTLLLCFDLFPLRRRLTAQINTEAAVASTRLAQQSQDRPFDVS